MESIPKKFLGISNLICILPDDFQGDIQDALKLLLHHILSSAKKASDEVVEENDTTNGIFLKLLDGKFDNKVSMRFSFYEFNEDSQTYIALDNLKPGTRSEVMGDKDIKESLDSTIPRQ